ncbi:Uncharacterised protein [Klebsiella pneumoniae]|nr:Uncharacterised protein [Klebsiella pneumoniae]VAT56503.1 Uncharacterised protein [Klebsiella pneumoniae]
MRIGSVRLTYGHRYPLKELDYNESLELASNKHEQYSGLPEHQQSPILDCNPDLAYERVVTHSHQVNSIAKRYADSQNSLRGEPLHNSLRVMQNKPFLRGSVTYKNFVGQHLRGSLRPAQDNSESSWQFTALRGVTLFTEIKTLALLWIRPPTVDQQRSAIFQGLSLAGFSTDGGKGLFLILRKRPP